MFSPERLPYTYVDVRSSSGQGADSTAKQDPPHLLRR